MSVMLTTVDQRLIIIMIYNYGGLGHLVPLACPIRIGCDCIFIACDNSHNNYTCV